MNIDIKELIACIEKATEKMEVATRDEDYYAKRDSYSFSTLEYISPYKLIEALKDLTE